MDPPFALERIANLITQMRQAESELHRSAAKLPGAVINDYKVVRYYHHVTKGMPGAACSSQHREGCALPRNAGHSFTVTYSALQADRSGHCRIASFAHAVVLSEWHVVQGFGIWYFSVIEGVMNANVCALTFTSAIVVSIFGIWHATHALPAEPAW